MPIFEEGKPMQDMWLMNAHPKLKNVVGMLDRIIAIMHERNPNWCPYKAAETVTGGFYRPPKITKKSFHPKYQAFDLRIRKFETKYLRSILAIMTIMGKIDRQIQTVFEDDLFDDEGKMIRGKHVHIEIDTGNPV